MNHIKTRTRTKSNRRPRISGDGIKRNNRPSSLSGRNRNPKKKAVSNIDPNMLIKKAVYQELEIFKANRTFNQMPIHQKLKINILKKGFSEPTKIQDETLEHLIDGRDLLGVANTGTGKTAAFLIPIIERLLKSPQSFKSLIVVPTRELALQVEEEFKSLSLGMGLYAASFIGGTSVNRDLGQLRRNNHLIIGTPGRLLDLMERKALRIQDISVLILDEFDRMLDMGFVNDIKKMVRAMNSRKQTMLFSATVDDTQKKLIDELLQNPVVIKVSSGKGSTSDQIEQDIIRVPMGGDKFEMLLKLIDDQDFEKVLVFAETKRMVDKVNKKLNQSGIRSDLIHGNKSQNYRNSALDKFKKGNVKVLVATDVAARGIDVSDVTHVINFQLPMSFDSYVHRIGRTGRAGKTGKAFTFID